jgi:hypothetical protein
MTTHEATSAKIDYTAKADVYFLPPGDAFKSQTPDWLDISLADAIGRILKLPEDEQRWISIGVAERGAIDIEEAKAIAQREDFPRK